MRIVKKDILAQHENARIVQMEIFSPLIAKKARPGQFVVIMVKEEGERVPLTIVDHTPDTITVIFQEVGLTTHLLGTLKEGDTLYALLGPLGNPTHIDNFGKVILVGGGVGVAELYPVARAMKDAGNYVEVIIGARTKAMVILEEYLKVIADNLFVTTDDGSYARRGFTTDVLVELLQKERYNLIYAVGPIPMMRKVAQVTEKFGVRTVVSLATLMVDATGMCGVCRVTVGGKVKFTCVDGPEFDAHSIDWDEVVQRNSIYREKEQHICKLYDL